MVIKSSHTLCDRENMISALSKCLDYFLNEKINDDESIYFINAIKDQTI